MGLKDRELRTRRSRGSKTNENGMRCIIAVFRELDTILASMIRGRRSCRCLSFRHRGKMLLNESRQGIVRYASSKDGDVSLCECRACI